jgi:hypothetical protein
MTLTRKSKIIIVIISLAISFATGRYTVPEKVKIETKIVTVEAKTDDKKVNVVDDKHVKTTVTETDKPDGSKTVTTVTQDDSVDKDVTADKSTDSIQKTSDITKTVTKGSSPVTISALAGVSVSNTSGGIVYGASIYKPVLGPIGIGLWGVSSGQVGASVGITF